MVPLWDMLNHVTGRCNVRLHHDEEAGSLQMIATAAVGAGGALSCWAVAPWSPPPFFSPEGASSPASPARPSAWRELKPPPRCIAASAAASICCKHPFGAYAPR